MDALELRRRGLGEMASDRKRGASQLARRALEIIANYARAYPAKDSHELAEAVQTLSVELRDLRPSMAAVRNLVNRFLSALGDVPDKPLEAARSLVLRNAEDVAAQSRRAVSEVARRAADLVEEGQTVITHSVSSTLLEVFRALAPRNVRAVITESAPLREGLVLARELSRLGVETEYITDAQIGVFAVRSDVALVGADSVLRDGTAVNKAGTYLLALAADDAGIPFYVCCESFKFTDRSAEEVTLEEMAASELSVPPLHHVHVRNIYFDTTPARLITAVVTEQGVLPPPAARSPTRCSP